MLGHAPLASAPLAGLRSVLSTTDVLAESVVFGETNIGVAVNVLVDRLLTTGAPYAFAEKFVTLNDTAELDARMVVVWRMLAAENLDLVGAALGNLSKLAVAIDILHAAGIVGSHKEAKVEIAQVLAITTLMRGGWKAEAADTAVFGEALTGTLRLLGSALDSIGFDENVAAGVRMLAIAEDELDLSVAAGGVSQLFERLSDDVLLYTTLRIGADDYVGWVLNEGAPSEYRSFPMNGLEAFAGSYFGTASDGLYELVGDDDEGEDIDASFRTALWDFGTGQLKGQIEAYAALSTDGSRMVFKVITTGQRGEVTETIYTQPVTAGDLHTERLKIGKALVGTYWQFELANVDGADFDVDSLDFRPMILTRRV